MITQTKNTLEIKKKNEKLKGNKQQIINNCKKKTNLIKK